MLYHAHVIKRDSVAKGKKLKREKIAKNNAKDITYKTH